MFFHETTFTLRYGPEYLTDKMYFSVSIDLRGSPLMSKDLGYDDENKEVCVPPKRTKSSITALPAGPGLGGNGQRGKG